MQTVSGRWWEGRSLRQDEPAPAGPPSTSQARQPRSPRHGKGGAGAVDKGSPRSLLAHRGCSQGRWQAGRVLRGGLRPAAPAHVHTCTQLLHAEGSKQGSRQRSAPALGE